MDQNLYVPRLTPTQQRERDAHLLRRSRLSAGIPQKIPAEVAPPLMVEEPKPLPVVTLKPVPVEEKFIPRVKRLLHPSPGDDNFVGPLKYYNLTDPRFVGPRWPRLDHHRIQRIVAPYYNVTVQDMLSSRKTANLVLARQVAMYLCRVLTGKSMVHIGRHFGGRDHTTVLHAYKKIGWKIGDTNVIANYGRPLEPLDTDLIEEIRHLKEKILQA